MCKFCLKNTKSLEDPLIHLHHLVDGSNIFKKGNTFQSYKIFYDELCKIKIDIVEKLLQVLKNKKTHTEKELKIIRCMEIYKRKSVNSYLSDTDYDLLINNTEEIFREISGEIKEKIIDKQQEDIKKFYEENQKKDLVVYENVDDFLYTNEVSGVNN